MSDLPTQLRDLQSRLAAHDEPELAAVRELLERSLLPRLAGEGDDLVVGIVGPNNAGKSALFNSLVGADLSPSLPTGGATRTLVGAAHPSLIERLEQNPSLARFRMRRADNAREEALVSPDHGAELLLQAQASMAPGLMLVDAPDFDSIHEANRAAAEALLLVADLVLVVVTKHTYQNRDVVEFLEGWVQHDRPWVCVYNEAPDAERVRPHVDKLVSDVGDVAPEAIFSAPYSSAVAEGQAPLVPVAGDQELHGWLAGARLAELKRRSLDGTLLEFQAQLGRCASALRERREIARGFENEATHRAEALASDIASTAMPMGPFLEAFRAVLDRRPGALQRGLRGTLKQGRSLVEGLARKLTGKAKVPVDPDEGLADRERAALHDRWPPFFEGLVRHDPMPAGLDDELCAERLNSARDAARDALARDPEVMRAFREACEELVEQELDGRSNEWALQLAVDAMHLLPAAAAGVVIVQTGGLGADLAVGGAGAMSSMMAERASRLLGSGVAARARTRWVELRGPRLADCALNAAMPGGWPAISKIRAADADLVALLERAEEEISDAN